MDGVHLATDLARACVLCLFNFSFSLARMPLTFSELPNVTASGGPEGKGEIKIYENLNDLATDLAEYIAQLSELSVKERGVFSIALSGGSIISMLG